MTLLKHPNVVPDLVIDVPDDYSPAYIRSGWLPEKPESPAETPKEKK